MHVVDALLLAGMEYGVIKIVNRLPAAIEPSIGCLRFQADVTKSVLDPKVRVISLNKPTARNYSLVLTLAALFTRQRIDVVHSHNWQTYLYAVLGARMAGVPVVIHGEHGHDDLAPSRRRLWVKRRVAPLVTRFLAVSPNIEQELRDEWGIAPERIRTIPNGVDLSRFDPRLDGGPLRAKLGLGPGHEVAINIGGLRSVKDHATLIRAFARAHATHPLSRLLIVGSDYQGRRQGELEELARSLGVRDAILFTGVRADVPELLAASDVYVNSSTYEGMSNTILEAMAMGKPVIATMVGGNTELVREGATGYLIPPGDPEAMADRLGRLFAEPSVRREIGEAGRAYVERNHRMSHMIASYADVYLESFDRSWLGRRAPARQRAKRLVAGAIVSSRIPWIRRRIKGHGLAVLAYHRILPLQEAQRYPFQGMVLPRDEFERQVAHLARSYHVLPFPEAVARLRARTLPPKAVALSFDDGYRDNYEHAWPILQRFQVPAIFFLVTDVLDKGRCLWWDEMAEAVSRLASAGASLDPLPGWVREGLGPRWREDPFLASARLVKAMNHRPRAPRLGGISAVRTLAGTASEDRSGLMMTWDQAREMLRGGTTFGSHTCTHAFLDELEDEEAYGEVSRSTRRLREVLDPGIRWLAFPRRPGMPSGTAILERAGIEAAVSADAGINRVGTNLLALQRIDAGYCRLHAGFDSDILDAELSGLLAPLRND